MTQNIKLGLSLPLVKEKMGLALQTAGNLPTNDRLGATRMEFLGWNKGVMALFIPHRCPKCFENVTVIQPQHNGGA